MTYQMHTAEDRAAVFDLGRKAGRADANEHFPDDRYTFADLKVLGKAEAWYLLALHHKDVELFTDDLRVFVPQFQAGYVFQYTEQFKKRGTMELEQELLKDE